MITQEQYDEITTRLTALQSWCGTSGAPYKSDDVPPACRVSNEECSMVEVFDFCHNKPTRYFAYVKINTQRESQWDIMGTLTTWNGDVLATITRIGKRWRSNFGDKRQALTAKGVNGLWYSATYYESAGDYCRMRAIK